MEKAEKGWFGAAVPPGAVWGAWCMRQGGALQRPREGGLQWCTLRVFWGAPFLGQKKEDFWGVCRFLWVPKHPKELKTHGLLVWRPRVVDEAPGVCA